MVQDCSPLDALQSGINRIPVAIRDMDRKFGKVGDLIGMVLTCGVGVVAIISMCYLYCNSVHSSRYICKNIVCRL